MKRDSTRDGGISLHRRHRLENLSPRNGSDRQGVVGPSDLWRNSVEKMLKVDELIVPRAELPHPRTRPDQLQGLRLCFQFCFDVEKWRFAVSEQ